MCNVCLTEFDIGTYISSRRNHRTQRGFATTTPGTSHTIDRWTVQSSSLLPFFDTYSHTRTRVAFLCECFLCNPLFEMYRLRVVVVAKRFRNTRRGMRARTRTHTSLCYATRASVHAYPDNNTLTSRLATLDVNNLTVNNSAGYN